MRWHRYKIIGTEKRLFNWFSCVSFHSVSQDSSPITLLTFAVIASAIATETLPVRHCFVFPFFLLVRCHITKNTPCVCLFPATDPRSSDNEHSSNYCQALYCRTLGRLYPICGLINSLGHSYHSERLIAL